MKKLFTTILLMVAITAWAYDAEVDGLYYNLNSTDKTAKVTYKTTDYNSYSGSVVIPSSITYNGNTYSVTSIGPQTFYNCTGLTFINIPNSVTSIGNGAFSYCTGLASVTIPNSVASIVEAFQGCSGLSSISVEAGNAIYDSRENCNAIIETSSNTLISGCKNTVIPNSVTSIDNFAFQNCTGLTSITIPNSVTSIGYGAFSDCSGLTFITIPNSVTSIGGYTFSGCSGLTSITIPNSVTLIGDGAFQYCSGLTSITIPNNVTTIGDYVFQHCYGLTSINIPNSVTSIGNYAFWCCTGLISITVPNSVTSIGENAFNWCTGLTSVTCLAMTPPSYGSSAFSSDVQSSAPLYVPNSAKSAYQQADGWKDFANIVGEALVSLSDASSSISAGSYSEGDLEYTRTGSAIKDGNYGSFCLPYDIDLSQTSCFKKVYVPMELSFYNTSTNLLSLFMKIVDANSVVKAGTPFIAVLNGNPVVLDNSSDVTFADSYDNPTAKQLTVFDFDGAISGALLEDENLTLEWGGTYKKTSPYDTMYSFKTNGNFGTQTSALNPFRAFIVKKEKSSAAKVAGIQAVFSDEDATGIEELMSQVQENIKQPVKVYTIDGRLVGTGMNKETILSGLSKGVYIMNGKKIFK